MSVFDQVRRNLTPQWWAPPLQATPAAVPLRFDDQCSAGWAGLWPCEFVIRQPEGQPQLSWLPLAVIRLRIGYLQGWELVMAEVMPLWSMIDPNNYAATFWWYQVLPTSCCHVACISHILFFISNQLSEMSWHDECAFHFLAIRPPVFYCAPVFQVQRLPVF